MSAALKHLHLAAGGDPATAESVATAVRLVCRAIADGDTWVDLASAEEADGGEALVMAVGGSPVVTLAGTDAPADPLVLDGSRLYFARYWQYERQLAQRLRAANRPVDGLDLDGLKSELDRHFPPVEVSPNWQKVAAAAAVLRRLCVISGGPGTGKTTTVVRILAILLTLHPGLRIAIAAPTGKAAARVQESIRKQLADLDLPDAIAAAMPGEPFTLHRLLGYQPGRAAFRHHEGHRLPYDVVVIDEASMLDLALAAKLVGALRDDARLILLGDKDQLSSVEAGAVYAGLSSTRAFDAGWAAQLSALTGQPVPAMAAPDGALGNAVVWLEHSYRFGATSPLGQLARAVNAGDFPQATALLASGAPVLACSAKVPSVRQLADRLFESFEPYAQAVEARRPAKEIFEVFDRFRVLCSTREGAYGSRALGALLVTALRRRLGEAAGTHTWFVGRPVLVRANDYALRLFNGDVGIVLPDESGQPMVHFPTTDGGLRTIYPSRLGTTQDAMAITVHRSQGSEFDRVAVVLEPTVTRGLSRQLIYTAVTRARSGVSLWGALPVI
ncbi:MAG TPA: exodeoxyribonuclease V subunit alpha [Nevskiaceae bacterium]|nr:exodeoxyribonuclease V subunit alpha [Nevskiaceae bacterium]